MMTDTPIAETHQQDRGILIADVGKSYLLLDGEAHLGAMLSGNQSYPTPVHCLRFSSTADLVAHLPEDVELEAMWRVHPAIIERLRQNAELIEVVVAETN